MKSRGPQPDREYVEARNRLIDVAAKMADFEVGPEPLARRDRQPWSERWDRAYHRAMFNLTTDPFMKAIEATNGGLDHGGGSYCPYDRDEVV